MKRQRKRIRKLEMISSTEPRKLYIIRKLHPKPINLNPLNPCIQQNINIIM